ncbi:hypothetical protein CHK_0340 [Christensenella hongkongensis]|uniref:Uncharacterized protein n=1 Tax=Christensenella hongkongensis TaxID=270498 RepID=A0A0M2NP99_9FIRM|nr:hypothetical protein CHK_0340 [Christensenella hongkongensis]
MIAVLSCNSFFGKSQNTAELIIFICYLFVLLLTRFLILLHPEPKFNL